MWALIVFFPGYNFGFTVPGFETKKLCDRAGLIIVETLGASRGRKYIGCVQQSIVTPDDAEKLEPEAR